MMSIWKRKYDKIQVGRKQYRIEYNWNAICSCMESEGMNFGQLAEFEKLDTSKFISLLYYGIIEGARLENKIFPHSKEDFGAMLTPESITQLSMIFQRQNTRKVKDLEGIIK